MNEMITICEGHLEGIWCGIDFHPSGRPQFDEVHRPVAVWLFSRHGRAASGASYSAAEFLADPRRVAEARALGADWFVPVLERMKSGEVFDPDHLRTLAAQNRDKGEK